MNRVYVFPFLVVRFPEGLPFEGREIAGTGWHGDLTLLISDCVLGWERLYGKMGVRRERRVEGKR